MVALQFFPIDMPCEFDFTISRSTKTMAQNVLVRLTYTHNGNDYTGLGEAVPTAFYGNSQDSLLEFLAWVQDENWLETLTPFDIQQYNETVSHISGHMPAKAAIEMALYDLMGQITGQPLYRLFGLNPQAVPRSSYTIGIADEAMIRHKTETALSRGYDILKVKVGGPADLKTLELIRSLIPDSVTLRVDANAAWQPDEALKLLPQLVEFGVEFVEEPLQLDVRISERLRLKENSPLPLIADESVHTLRDIPVVAQWMDGINLKLTKTGGITEALRMIHTARAHNLSVMLGCFPESSVSITAFAHLSPLVDYLDLDGGLLLANDPAQGVTWDANQLTLPTAPGLGVVWHEKVLTV